MGLSLYARLSCSFWVTFDNKMRSLNIIYDRDTLSVEQSVGRGCRWCVMVGKGIVDQRPMSNVDVRTAILGVFDAVKRVDCNKPGAAHKLSFEDEEPDRLIG